MDTTTPCIPLAHIQTYFDLRKSLIMQVDWLEKRSQIKLHNPHELLEVIIGINPEEFYQKANIDYNVDVSNCFISVDQCLSLVGQAITTLEMPYLGLVMGY